MQLALLAPNVGADDLDLTIDVPVAGIADHAATVPANEALRVTFTFAATHNTLDHTIVRPRLPSYPAFQPQAGAIVHEGLRARSAATASSVPCGARATVRTPTSPAV